MSPQASGIAAVIKQSKPFKGPEHRVFLGLQRAVSELTQEVAELLKPAGLTGAQYNVLRILRGAGKEGLSCGEIGNRLITRDPDMTRLLDRMERQGLVTRARHESDRRVVTTRVTPKALKLLDDLDDRVHDLHREQLGHLGTARLNQLAELLDLVIKPVGQD